MGMSSWWCVYVDSMGYADIGWVLRVVYMVMGCAGGWVGM
jgi:hypothetical protein